MKVLLLTSWGTALPHVTNGYANGFRQFGHDVEVFNMDMRELKSQEEKEQFIKKNLYEYVHEFSPDLVLFYAVLGMVPGLTNRGTIWDELQIPYVLLFYDNPFIYLQTLPAEYRKEIVESPLSHLVISDKEYMKALKSVKKEKIIHLPLATDAALFDQVISKEDLDKFSCDLSFVGSVEDDPLNVSLRRMARLAKAPALNRIVDQIVCPDKNIRTDVLMSKLDVLKEQIDLNSYAILSRIIYEEAMTKYRVEVIKLLEEYQVDLYGKDGWKAIANKNLCYKGYLDYEHDAVKLYQASKININITHPQLITTVNQRLFDVSAAGGFIFSDYRSDLHELFDGAIDSFKSKKELHEKVEYYLKHDNERKERATKAKEITLKRHLWKHRVKELLEIL